MALVKSVVRYPIFLADGSPLGFGEQDQADLSVPANQRLLDEGLIVVIDGSTPPAQPSTRNVGVEAVVPFAQATPFVMDLRGATPGQAIGVDGKPTSGGGAGSVGPAGPTGPAGPKGDKGDPGAGGASISPSIMAGARLDSARTAFSRVKTNRRAVVYFRFDDTPAIDYATVLPLLEARGFVGGFAVASAFISGTGPLSYADEWVARNATGQNATLGQGCTVAQCLDMQARGMELMSHTRWHGDPTTLSNAPAGITLADYVKQDLVDHVALMRAQGMNTDAFVQPGTQTGAYYLDTEDKLQTEYGRMLAENFAMAEGYVYGAAGIDKLRPFPTDRRFGYQNTSVESAASLANLTGQVDTAIRVGGVCGFLTHTLQLGTTGKRTMADFTALLDYVKTKVDAGQVEVVSPSAAYFIQHGAPESLIEDGSFEAQATAITPPWYVAAGTPTVLVGGGQDGKNIMQTSATNQVRQFINTRTARRFRLEGYVRGTGGTTGRYRVIVRGQDKVPASVTNFDKQADVPGTTWTKFSWTFGIDARAVEQQVWLYSGGTGPVEYSNVRAYAL